MPTHKRSSYNYFYFAILLLSLHYGFTLYVNSTYLNLFFQERTIDLLYMLGAFGTLLGLMASSTLIRKYGNYSCMIFGLIAEAIVLFNLAYTHNPVLIAFFFIFHQMLPPLLLFSMDVFVEGAITTEKITGRIRSNYLTISNLALVLAPFFVGGIISIGSYQTVYLFSSIFITFLLILIIEHFKTVKVTSFREVNFIDSIQKFPFRQGLTSVFFINILLQCFYALMVIYIPLYLHNVIGFNWAIIGTLFTIMLLPFIIFEAPLGRLFDHIHAEKDTIILGFLIMSITTLTVFMTHVPSFWLWAAILFCSRVGASFVEIGSEYSFFKRVNDRDAGLISIFRMTLPLSYIIAPIAAFTISIFLPLQYIFIVLSLSMLCGIPIAYTLNSIPQKYLKAFRRRQRVNIVRNSNS